MGRGNKLLARDRFHIEGAQLARALDGITGIWKGQGTLFVVTVRPNLSL